MAPLFEYVSQTIVVVLLVYDPTSNCAYVYEMAPIYKPDFPNVPIYYEFVLNYFCKQYYTSPISNYTFTMKSEVLEYLFSGTDERMLESKERGAENTLQVHA